MAVSNTTLLALMHWAGWRKKKRTILHFNCFWLATLKIVTTHCSITTADWGKLYKLLYVLEYTNICSLAMTPPYTHVNANTLIGAAILFLGYP